MQDVLIAVRTETDERGERHTFHYLLLIAHGGHAHGVRVDEVGGGSARVCPLMKSRTHTLRLVRFLAAHAVTPAELAYVLADLGVVSPI